jgi:hypothetical protein
MSLSLFAAARGFVSISVCLWTSKHTMTVTGTGEFVLRFKAGIHMVREEDD